MDMNTKNTWLRISFLMLALGIFVCAYFFRQSLYPYWDKFEHTVAQWGILDVPVVVRQDDGLRETIKNQYSAITDFQAQIQEQQDLIQQLQSTSTVPSSKTILLVAGHTERSPGAVYAGVTEYELNYELMNLLRVQLDNLGYQTIVSHKDGDYSYRFRQFFEQNRDKILQFRQSKKRQYEEQYPLGVTTNDTSHNIASPEGVLQLYGVNYWVEQNDIDAVIHIHFNDYAGRQSGERGIHSGFVVLTPLKTNRNFAQSFLLAKSLEESMLQVSKRSTVKAESAGVAETELIAPGYANTVSVPAVLLETGFVYEKQYANRKNRTKILSGYAQALARGVDKFFLRP